MIVEKINEIDDSVFDTIYNANTASIIQNTGYDNKEQLKHRFSSVKDTFNLFSFTKDGEVVGYVQGSGKDDTITIFNSVTKSTSVLEEGVAGSNFLLKSLGFVYLQVDCVKNVPMYSWIKASCNRTDLFEYVSEEERENDIIVKLKLL